MSMKPAIPHCIESFILASLHPRLGWLRWTEGNDLRVSIRLEQLKKAGYLDGINYVIDAGANEGAFAKVVSAVLPQMPVYCFEPIPATYARLQKTTSRLKAVQPVNLALGSESTTLPMYTCPHDESNSLLPSTRTFIEAWPEVNPNGQVKVGVTRLDDFIAREKLHGRFFLKADVQGYELELLKGGGAALNDCVLLQLECSIVKMYENSPMVPELWDFVGSLGFQFLMLFDVLNSPRTQQPVSCDIFFYKPNQCES